eukprot:7388735-Prymnesium_polylepis.1
MSCARSAKSSRAELNSASGDSKLPRPREARRAELSASLTFMRPTPVCLSSSSRVSCFSRTSCFERYSNATCRLPRESTVSSKRSNFRARRS